MFQKALTREIAAVLLFKAVALAALYFAFFAGSPNGLGATAIFAPQGAGAAIFRPPAGGGAAP